MNYKYKLLIGLGNPGEDYKNTYHNAGLLFLDRLTAKSKFKACKNFEYAEIGDVVVIRPLTFMNESGKAVKSALKYFSAKGGSAAGGKIKTKNLLVVHDDSDIEFGKHKLSLSRGSAGHKGIESIIRTLGSKEFARLRIGIRPKANPPSLNLHAGKAKIQRTRAGEFVLKKMRESDLKVIYDLADKLRVELLQ